MADFAVSAFLVTTAVLSAPLVLAAMGGLASERSGVINIALEGKMLTAACVTALVAIASGSALIGLGVGILSAIAISLLHGMLTQTFRVDHIVSGMAINAIAYGLTKFLNGKVADQRAAGFPHLSVWVYVFLAAAIPLVLFFVIRNTRYGVRLFAVGNNPEKCRANGIDPVRIRFASLVLTGLFCGLAGSLIVTDAGQFGDNMTAGKGFIALAALILGGWRPLPVLATCVAFGAIDALQLQFQGVPLFGIEIVSEAWNALPYLATLLAIAFVRSKGRAPAALGQP